MNITSGPFASGSFTAADVPGTIWAFYLEYLVYYKSDSWVATIAYSFRLLAFLVTIPTLILGMLDIASYAIARTLGVVDATKASTSDKSTVHTTGPAIHVDDYSGSSGDQVKQGQTPPTVYYVGEDTNLKLAGADVFSPAASQPPSPTTSRQNLSLHFANGGEPIRYRGGQVLEEADKES